MRLIDADALKEKAFGKRGGLIHTSDVDDMPTIEPEQKMGKWIIDKDCEGKTRYVTCNICGHKEFNWYDPNFCPNCGSEMEGES